jgi:hypothetical protein
VRPTGAADRRSRPAQLTGALPELYRPETPELGEFMVALAVAVFRVTAG